jgi:hypothetical protein
MAFFILWQVYSVLMYHRALLLLDPICNGLPVGHPDKKNIVHIERARKGDGVRHLLARWGNFGQWKLGWHNTFVGYSDRQGIEGFGRDRRPGALCCLLS